MKIVHVEPNSISKTEVISDPEHLFINNAYVYIYDDSLNKADVTFNGCNIIMSRSAEIRSLKEATNQIIFDKDAAVKELLEENQRFKDKLLKLYEKVC